jgi:hypothetical protein
MTLQEEKTLELDQLQNSDEHRASNEWDGLDSIGAGATAGAADTHPPTGIAQSARPSR